MSNVTQFQPTRVIVLAELSTREKEKYYQALLTNKAKFHRDEKGRYVASIRLLAPGVKKEAEIKKITGNSKDSVPLEDRLTRLENEFVNVRIVGVESFDYSIYNRLSLLIALENDVVRPKPQSLFWLMKRIESLYDARFVHEKMDVERDDVSLSENASISSIFPVFIVKRLCTEKGLIKTIVDQNCWDLLYNVHVYRHDYLEVEIFARFLQEFYDNDDLLFYLYVRSVISKVLNVSFKNRWGKADGPARQPKGLWMSYRECVQVARIVFGVQNETMWRRFLDIINPQMVGQKTETVDTRRIDITQFLHLAVVGYHQTVPASGGPDKSAGDMIRNAAGSYPGMMDPSENGETNDGDGSQLGGVEQANNFPWNTNRYFDNRDAQLYGANMLDNANNDRDGLLESKDSPPYENEEFNDGINEDEYGSSLDAYLAALSADETGKPLPIELLSGSPRRVEILNPPLVNFGSSPSSGIGMDIDDEDEPPPPPPASGALSPGAAIAVAAAMKAANAAADAVRKQQGSSKGIEVNGPEYQGYFNINAPSLPSQPRLPAKLNLQPTTGRKAFMNEVGQWQDEDDDEAAHNPRNGGNNKSISLSDIAGGTDFEASPTLGGNADVQISDDRANLEDRRPSAASESFGDRPQNTAMNVNPKTVDEFGFDLKSTSGDADSAPNSVRRQIPSRGLLQSYQSGYAFDDEELEALKHQQAIDEAAEDERVADNEAGNENVNSNVGASLDNEDVNIDAFASLQLEREREFLSYVCAPLAELPEQIAEGIVDELATNLRTKLNSTLETRVIADIDTFDEILLEILQSDDLRIEMETMRDSMLQYLFQQVEGST